MPTLLRLDGFRVTIYNNDHPPPHVHVFAGGEEMLFNLNCPAGPATSRINYGLSERDYKRAVKLLLPHIPELCATWEKIYGKV